MFDDELVFTLDARRLLLSMGESVRMTDGDRIVQALDPYGEDASEGRADRSDKLYLPVEPPSFATIYDRGYD